MLIIYILNPDKEPLPWRTYCAAQMPFPHIFADRLAPVDVLVGVLTVDNKYERRNMIRSTYASHTLPLGPDGRPMANVQVKFILGKVRKAHARRVALEMEAYNDIVVLDMDENMSARKTLTFLKWAAQNATMPFVRPSAPLSAAPETPGHVSAQLPDKARRSDNVAWKKVDYVVKADDDSFIVLSELERHLRVAPRKMTYWGYLVKEWFMGGEAYALSMDLVEWLAHSPEVERTAKGKEDTRTPQWIAMHPNRSSVSWISEHCWIYDHPKAGTPYSHGFLFPDYVERIKAEARVGLSEQEVMWRGGERRSHSYSTVSRWHHAYVAPRDHLTAEEEIEALVEGGGRWAGTWVRGAAGEGSSSETETWLPWSDIVYESDDERLRRAMAADREAEKLRLLPRPTHKDGDGTAEALRARRYLGRPHGGTVVVHYLKKSEWWLETAMVFLGRGAMWQSDIGGAAREYRQYGSPLVRHDGYISEGRSQPRPDQGVNVAEGDERWTAIAGKKERPPADKPSTESTSTI
ncbi:hypothetical protein FA09DRAFT_292491 [Tilletiopsis washingtonensis]|uniref:Hexosyltransferase n=1 Tax=Tilletiopsis washingtonensis TaxID=58919 RepID=A0A316ZIL3_9BASI|nr:hypothetical protein FA09DRAFT_292491 [Tilletiopsis washingtonensis]PWO01372.1 hypothetical protein FA09DRAFT_292491 [Tilletiopsis washingtonensis]